MDLIFRFIKGQRKPRQASTFPLNVHCTRIMSFRGWCTIQIRIPIFINISFIIGLWDSANKRISIDSDSDSSHPLFLLLLCRLLLLLNRRWMQCTLEGIYLTYLIVFQIRSQIKWSSSDQIKRGNLPFIIILHINICLPFAILISIFSLVQRAWASHNKGTIKGSRMEALHNFPCDQVL